MIILFNPELVIAEVLELARMKIVEEVGHRVSVEVTLADGKLKPTFTVLDGSAGPIITKFYQDSIASIWLEVRPVLRARIAGLSEARHYG